MDAVLRMSSCLTRKKNKLIYIMDCKPKEVWKKVTFLQSDADVDTELRWDQEAIAMMIIQNLHWFFGLQAYTHGLSN